MTRDTRNGNFKRTLLSVAAEAVARSCRPCHNLRKHAPFDVIRA
jgi:hypothetical protein